MLYLPGRGKCGVGTTEIRCLRGSWWGDVIVTW